MPVIMNCLKNTVSRGVCEYLKKEYKLESIIRDVDADVLEFAFNEDADLVIVPSTHRSEAHRKSLTVHVPGNWSGADLGGEPRTLNIGYGSRMKAMLMKIRALAEHRGMAEAWSITLEVDHHGPTINRPIFFVEIGSTEDEWNDRNALNLIGDAIVMVLDDTNSYDNVIGYGGTHYAPRFTKHELDPNASAYVHICPRYRFDEIDYAMFEQAIEKSVEDIVRIEIEKKGLLSLQKKRVRQWCESYGIESRIIH